MFTREVRDSLRLTCSDLGELRSRSVPRFPSPADGGWTKTGIRYFGRSYEEGNKINWKDGLKALWYLLQFRLQRNSGGTRYAGAALAGSLCLFLFLTTVFAVSPIRLPTELLRWSIHTAMSFAEGHFGDLTEYLPILEKEKFYAIEYPDGSPRTVYPIGPSLLAMPVVAAIVTFRRELADESPDPPSPPGPSSSSPALSALSPELFFFWLILSQFQSRTIALVSTAIFAFSTSMWSTATRALWQHGPLVLMLVIAMPKPARGAACRLRFNISRSRSASPI